MKDETTGTWVISNTYVDPETKLICTETDNKYGPLSDVMESTIHNWTTFDLRFQKRD